MGIECPKCSLETVVHANRAFWTQNLGLRMLLFLQGWIQSVPAGFNQVPERVDCFLCWKWCKNRVTDFVHSGCRGEGGGELGCPQIYWLFFVNNFVCQRGGMRGTPVWLGKKSVWKWKTLCKNSTKTASQMHVAPQIAIHCWQYAPDVCPRQISPRFPPSSHQAVTK